MNVYFTRNHLWGRLTSLRIDIALLKMAGNDTEILRQLEIEALQVAIQLKAKCAKVLQ
jgi:hypothetical protein